MVASQEDKLTVASEFYEQLLGSAEERAYTLNLPAFHNQQQPQDLSALDEPFSVDGVWATIKSMPMDKAPGPDAFTSRFTSAVGILLRILLKLT